MVCTGGELLVKLRKMRSLADDEEEVTPAASTEDRSSQQPTWMRTLLKTCEGWLQQLPEVDKLSFSLLIMSDLEVEIQRSYETVRRKSGSIIQAIRA
jgi:hypothetical protein